MYSQFDLYTYVMQLQQVVYTQSKQLKTLEIKIKQLEQEMNELKKQPTTNVERIEYKFDQLKIETLEGTLNIGLNPNDLSSIEDFAVEQDAMKVAPAIQPQHQQVYRQVYEETNRYLNEDCIDVIKNLEEEQNRNLDETYYEFMIEDVKKQIHHRILYYINQYKESLNNSAEMEKYKHLITENIKNDINRTFSSFLQNLPNELKGGIQ